MSFNDLKIFPKISHLRETMRGGLNYVHWKTYFLSSDGASSASCLSSMRRSLSRQFQGQGIYLSRPVSVYGLCSTHLSRKPSRYRGLSSCPEEQTLPHGYPRAHFSQYSGQCHQNSRLAHLRRSCPRSYPDRQKTLCERRLFPGTGKHGLCTGCHYYRPVPL